MIKRKGLSEVVSTVLIILITIAAVAFIANLAIPFVRNNLQHSTECLAATNYFKFDDAQGYDCYDQNGLYGFSVQAGNGGEVAATDQISNQPHSADYNRNWIIGIDELNNFTRLYNYNNGTVRTGQYHCDHATLDGYSPGPGDITSCQPNSGDYNRNWQIDTTELTRLTQLYNTQGGKYHAVAANLTSPDGYDFGASTQSAAGISLGNNITGFGIVFGSSTDSATVKIFDSSPSNSALGGIRMLNRTLAVISVPKPGETQTFVYNAGSAKYSKIDIYPILQSGRLCEKSDSLSVNICKGVSLTP